MGQRNRWTWAARHLATVALLGGISATARAAEMAPPVDMRQADTLGTAEKGEDGEPTGPNHGRVSFSLTNDFTTAYFFRGVLQERNGFIWQPSAEIFFNLYDGEGALSSIDLGFGIWNSFQSKKTGATGGPTNLYETDYYPTLSASWADHLLTTSVTYNVYTSPNGAFSTSQEVVLGLELDDSELLGPFAMRPNASFAFETENTAFGDDEGGYAEFGIEPSVELSFPMDDAGHYPITASFPLALGISLYDYYNDGVDNDTFGFFSFGLAASVPLSFIPEDLGSWSIGAGINVLVLSDTLKDANFGDNPFPVGTASLVMEY